MGARNSVQRTLSAVQDGQFLIEAAKVPLDAWFPWWMERKARKTLAGQWHLLYENDEYAYFGLPIHRLFSSELIVQGFVRVSLDDLEAQYPVWRTGHGLQVKKACKAALLEQWRRKGRDGSRCQISLSGKDVSLHDDYILCRVQCRKAQDPHNVATWYNIELDKTNLECLNIELIARVADP